MSEHSRYVVGIDLGTTNTALSFVDTLEIGDAEDRIPVQEYPVPQVVAPGAVEPRPTLPSALYVAGTSELPPGSLHLPWRAEAKVAIGQFAREQGAKIPTRLIHSSKSWLCHGGVNREEPILPWQSPETDARRSPAEAATLILNHLREAWDHGIAKGDASAALEHQEITLCVPASFDAGARNLTVAAAERAGFRNLHLLEEPQAALYSWIECAGPTWRKQVRVGELVLVVDVGGGTTDFSLIAVTEEDGELQLRRVAVGEHILLGGDNMDLALAYGVAQSLQEERGTRLDTFQMAALTQQCRIGKEKLLSDPSLNEYPIALLGRGSSVIGGTIRSQLKREGLDAFLLDGFFPACSLSDQPARQRRVGFREAGLPYAQDAAITRHLAAFLGRHSDMVAEVLPELANGGRAVLPTAILFNGGVFRAAPLRERILRVVTDWSQEAGRRPPRMLEGTDLDLAVSRGAAYLGVARRGQGIRIRGGSARSYYVGFEAPMPAVPGMEPPIKLLCLVPHGMEESTTRDISGEPMELCMWTGEEVEFRFFSSTTRRQDSPGTITDHDPEEIEEHSPIVTKLPAETGDADEGRAVEVDLRAHLTEIGVLELWCVERGTENRWKLEFNVRQTEESGGDHTS